MTIKKSIDTIPFVLIIGNGLSGGGAEGRFARLASMLFLGNLDVAVLTGREIKKNACKGKIIRLNWHHRGSYLRIVLQLRRHIEKNQYAIIMAFGLFPIVISAFAIIGLRKKPKFIINEITRPIMADTRASGIRRWFYTKLRQFSYKKADILTANSIDGLKETCTLAGTDETAGARLPNLLDEKLIGENLKESLGEFLPTDYYKNKYIICVGRLVLMKRIDDIIDALYKLKTESRFFLVIVGDGNHRFFLEEKAKKLMLQDQVFFTGHLVNPLPAFTNASVFILASEYEGYSNSVLEAMFCDVPVITSLCSSDAREMCEQGAALGFEVGDVEQLAEHIVAVMSDEALAQGLVSRAREYRAPHALENAIPVYENLIRRVAGYEESSG